MQKPGSLRKVGERAGEIHPCETVASQTSIRDDKMIYSCEGRGEIKLNILVALQDQQREIRNKQTFREKER